MSHSKLHVVLLAGALLAIGACNRVGPSVKVIGVADKAPTALTVFLQVVNPGRNDLQLSRLQYQIDAGEWFAGHGEVVLTRAVAPHATAVVELRVPLRSDRPHPGADVAYTLRGKLFAHDERYERSWKVTASGAISPRTGRADPIQIRVADSNR